MSTHDRCLRKVQQRGIPACNEILSALLDGVLDAGKVYRIFVIDTCPSKFLALM